MTGGIGVPAAPGEAFGGREEFRTTAFEEDGGTEEAGAAKEEIAAPGEETPEEELSAGTDEVCGASDETVFSEAEGAVPEAADEDAEAELAREAGGGTDERVGHSAVVHAGSMRRSVSKTGNMYFLCIRFPPPGYRSCFKTPNPWSRAAFLTLFLQYGIWNQPKAHLETTVRIDFILNYMSIIVKRGAPFERAPAAIGFSC